MSGNNRRSSPYVDYQLGKQAGFNPFNPYGYFTQAGIADRQREQRKAAEKKAEEESAYRVAAPRRAAAAEQIQPYIPRQTFTDTYPVSTSYPRATGYSYPSHPKSRWPRIFHMWWWQETGVFSSWEEISWNIVEANWFAKLLFGLLTAFVFLVVVAEWPWASMQVKALSPQYTPWIVIAAGAVTGFVVLPLLGRLSLMIRKAFVFSIVAILRIAVFAAVAAVAYWATMLIYAHV